MVSSSSSSYEIERQLHRAEKVATEPLRGTRRKIKLQYATILLTHRHFAPYFLRDETHFGPTPLIPNSHPQTMLCIV